MLREQWVPLDGQAYLRYISSLHAKRASWKVAFLKSKRKGLSRAERDAVLRKTAARCHICGGEVAEDWEADHVLAHAAGGTHSIDNYLPAHRVCNNYRWDYRPDEFQEILRLGVWIRTQIEKRTTIGIQAAELFVRNEMKRIKRRKDP